VGNGDYVLYWMQHSQRLHWNHAFEFAVEQANALGLPVVVVFGVTPDFPGANLRHYQFLFEGLADVARQAVSRGVSFIVQQGRPDEVCISLASRAALVVADHGYLRLERNWRMNVAGAVACRCIEVESDVVVPVQEASTKEEYSAATIRPKIRKQLAWALLPVEEVAVLRRVSDGDGGLPRSTTPDELAAMLNSLPLDRSVAPVSAVRGGTSPALAHLERFLGEKLAFYAERRNDPGEALGSGLSPYLHFGQVSPVYIAWRAAHAPASAGRDSFLEELIVRRELSMNFVAYNSLYDSYAALPHWAQATLDEHRHDRRPALYTVAEFEAARTHDPVWNACQTELTALGTMHNYMRMYWGKKILEWSPTPEEAFNTALYLNNKYQLDGRDPNSFAGVGWCFGKHDRPWPERPVFGKVRYMNEAGLRRKFDIEKYIRRVRNEAGLQAR
jgi:deoxyribodipyrimidine photo-lyase